MGYLNADHLMRGTCDVLPLLANHSHLHRTYTGVVAIAILLIQLIVIISILAGKGTLGHKLLWTALILLLPIIGLVLYAIFGRSSRDRPLME